MRPTKSVKNTNRRKVEVQVYQVGLYRRTTKYRYFGYYHSIAHLPKSEKHGPVVQQLEVGFCPLATSGQVVARASTIVLKDPMVLTRTGGDIAKNVNQTPEPIFLAHFHPL